MRKSKFTKKDLTCISNATYAEIIENRKPEGIFYTIEDGKFLSLDNEDGEAFTESHDTEKDMIDWLFNPKNY